MKVFKSKIEYDPRSTSKELALLTSESQIALEVISYLRGKEIKWMKVHSYTNHLENNFLSVAKTIIKIQES